MLDTPHAALPVERPDPLARRGTSWTSTSSTATRSRAAWTWQPSMRELRERGERLDTLAGESSGLAFAEASTRTRVSFEIAATALGAQVRDLPMRGQQHDQGRVAGGHAADLERTGVRRSCCATPPAGRRTSPLARPGCAIVNAGDGTHAHPTQALLDALTLRDALGGAGGRGGGDRRRHRPFARRALQPAAADPHGRHGPPGRPAGLDAGLRAGPGVEIHAGAGDALEGADAVMALRVQLERHAGGGVPSLREYTARWGLDEARMRLARPGAPILHPGPTNEGVELTAALAAARAA